MEPLDPWGPVIGLLFEDRSDDYILRTISKAGISSTLTHDLTPEENHSPNTRKRAYRKRLDAVVANYDELTRLRIATNIARELSGSPAYSTKLQQTLDNVGWVFRNARLSPLSRDHDFMTSYSSDLTSEQKSLLRQIAEVYQRGCKSEFLVSVTLSSPPTLVYMDNCHPNVAVNADTLDFEFLASQGLLQLRKNSKGDLIGKPTGRGIRVASDGTEEPQSPPVVPVVQASRMMAAPIGNKIFIGHGRSHLWKDLRYFLTDRLGLKCDEFNRESVAGRSTTDRLQEMLQHATFAFIVMTGEDEQTDGTTRARENVVHEAGLFQGRLGFRKAIILLENGCSKFSNIDGLTYIPFDKGRIETAWEDVRRVLEREGILND